VAALQIYGAIPLQGEKMLRDNCGDLSTKTQCFASFIVATKLSNKLFAFNNHKYIYDAMKIYEKEPFCNTKKIIK
jgi:hypothetical protein